ncbi:hypothetical protein LJU02_00255 [Corynebacterium pseudotuberculosis]|nr:hypothetical protein [Corynebacterium pseudotuberculosis]AER68169.1 Hypothetical protein Cp106_0041 [Corynebacterium pseudotuberculosis 1/06-A]AKS12395.1 Hypothetical protein CpE19_0051 [Corynebacterium pseudotuberculosis]APQ53177.1 Hypothetical protein CpMEX30_0056 [Corynebacterium pseudotuberculosis]APQ55230.1 Hypothetical protein CpMEX31_0054 [Corynebacterium pseudotuberculosis]ATB60950.1 Hypothetical protein BFF96_0054 [Corynebacterium pseudotuberculosis]
MSTEEVAKQLGLLRWLTGLSTATTILWISEPREDYLARANEKRARV